MAAATLVGCLLIARLPASAADPVGDPAAETQLASAIYGASRYTGSESPPTLYPMIYWMYMATRGGLSPAQALLQATQSLRHQWIPLFHLQLLVDWQVAVDYGLLTPGNLVCLQAGTPPLATAGRFTGQRIVCSKIFASRPVDLSNLAFCPEGQPVPAEAVVSPEAVRHGYAPPPVAVWPPHPTPGAAPSPRTAFRLNQPSSPLSMPNVVLPEGRVATLTTSPLPAGTSPLPAGASPGNIEVHDVPMNTALTIAKDTSLSLIFDNGNTLSVSVIGPQKVWVAGLNGLHYSQPPGLYPKVVNRKLAKTGPIHLPDISGSAYLILTSGAIRYYYIDDSFSTRNTYRIVQVNTAL